MSIFRRRLMMQAKAQPLECPYITDGLVFWLDGINKGKSSAGWQDLISKNVFPWIARTTQGENCVIFGDGSTNMENSNVAVFNASESTAEACGSKRSGRTYQMILYQAYTNGLLLSLDLGNKMLTFKSKGNDGRYTVNIPSTFTVSANSNLAIVNSKKVTSQWASDWDVRGDGTKIGARAGTHGYGGNIHCIRVYNRLLTEEEMLFNHQVDNERFNLGLEL